MHRRSLAQFVPSLRIPPSLTSASFRIYVSAMAPLAGNASASISQTKQSTVSKGKTQNRTTLLTRRYYPLLHSFPTDSRRLATFSDPQTPNASARRDGFFADSATPQLHVARHGEVHYSSIHCEGGGVQSGEARIVANMLSDTTARARLLTKNAFNSPQKVSEGKDGAASVQCTPPQFPVTYSQYVSTARRQPCDGYPQRSRPRALQDSVPRTVLPGIAWIPRSSTADSRDLQSRVREFELRNEVTSLSGMLIAQSQLLMGRRRLDFELRNRFRETAQDLTRTRRTLSGLRHVRNERDVCACVALASLERCRRLEVALTEAQSPRRRSLLLDGIARLWYSLSWRW